MFNIEQYLKKFSKNIQTLEGNKEKITLIINKYTKLNVESSCVEIKDYKIIVDTNSIGKSQLFLNKNKIIEEIKSTLDQTVIDIK